MSEQEIRVGEDGLRWLEETIDSLKEYPNTPLDDLAGGPPFDLQRLLGIRSRVKQLDAERDALKRIALDFLSEEALAAVLSEPEEDDGLG